MEKGQVGHWSLLPGWDGWEDVGGFEAEVGSVFWAACAKLIIVVDVC